MGRHEHTLSLRVRVCVCVVILERDTGGCIFKVGYCGGEGEGNFCTIV